MKIQATAKNDISRFFKQSLKPNIKVFNLNGRVCFSLSTTKNNTA